jgi:hypothetical protein
MSTRLNIFAISVMILGLSSCGAAKHAAPERSDSTRVEVRTITQTVHDTAYIELPVFVERNVTRDTTSTLENPYAKSEASITDGLLSHSLQTKPTRQPVKIEKEIVYRDSIVFRDHTETVTVEVEKELTKWQSFKMKTGGTTLAILIIAIVTAALYLFLKFKNLIKL